MTDYPENMTEILQTQIQAYWDNPNSQYTSIITESQLKTLTTRWYAVQKKRWVDAEEDFHILRMSAVGKPLIEMMFNKFHYEIYLSNRDLTTVHQHQRMVEGDEFEIDLAMHLLRMGFIFEDFEAGQRELNHRDVLGHTDYIVSHPEWTNGLPILFECKAIHEYHFTSNKKWIDDKYGYYSQLGLYTKLTDLPGFWFLYNKNTSEIYIKSYHSQGASKEQQEALDRLDLLITLWEMEDLTWEDCFRFCRPPEPVPEVYQGSYTNNFLIPPSMKFCNSTPYVYVLEEARNGYRKPTIYIRDYNYPEKYLDLKPDINDCINQQEDEEDA